MDINIISVNFQDKRKICLPQVPLSRPGIKKTRERIQALPCFVFLLIEQSLKETIQILQRADFDPPQKGQRYSYYSGFTPRQWCNILEQEVKNAKPFSDN